MWISVADCEWIEAVCRQLSRATGWPTVFIPAEHGLQVQSSHYAWISELQTEQTCIGRLSVELPPNRELDEDFLRACDATDLMAQLIQRVLIHPSIDAEHISRHTTLPHRPTLSTAQGWTLAVERVLDVALRLTGFRSAALFMLDRNASRLRLREQRTIDRQEVILFDRPLEDASFDLRALQGEDVVIRRRDDDFSEWLPDGMSLGVCRGVRTSTGAGGTFWLFDRRDRRLTMREHRIIESIVARLGTLIEQAVLLDESAVQRRLRAELRIAAESQPRQLVRFEADRYWCQAAGRTDCAHEVGGDLCDIIALSENRTMVAIGDAAGHSIPAAMVMAAVRGGLGTLVQSEGARDLDPSGVATRLNRALHGIVESHQFMTFCCAVLDREKSTLTLCNAGHPPPLLIRDRQVVALESHGLLLGVVDEAVYESRTFPLLPGDVLAFYTDGVSEASRDRTSQFRSEGIAAAIQPIVHRSPATIVERVWEALEAHVGDANADDRTLLIVRFNGGVADECGGATANSCNTRQRCVPGQTCPDYRQPRSGDIPQSVPADDQF